MNPLSDEICRFDVSKYNHLIHYSFRQVYLFLELDKSTGGSSGKVVNFINFIQWVIREVGSVVD